MKIYKKAKAKKYKTLKIWMKYTVSPHGKPIDFLFKRALDC